MGPSSWPLVKPRCRLPHGQLLTEEPVCEWVRGQVVCAVGAVTDIVIRDATPGADAAWHGSGW